MEWIATTDKPHPDKPGLRRYEQIPCLIVKNREILLRQWNCEHLVWDGEDGDDFYCKAEDVTHWMPLPGLPSSATSHVREQSDRRAEAAEVLP